MRSFDEIKRDIYIRSGERLYERSRRRKRIGAVLVSLCLFAGTFALTLGMLPESVNKDSSYGIGDGDEYLGECDDGIPDEEDGVTDTPNSDALTVTLQGGTTGTVVLTGDKAAELLDRISCLEEAYSNIKEGVVPSDTEVDITVGNDYPEEPGDADGNENTAPDNTGEDGTLTDAPDDTAPHNYGTGATENDTVSIPDRVPVGTTGGGFIIKFTAADGEEITWTFDGKRLGNGADTWSVVLDESDATELRELIWGFIDG